MHTVLKQLDDELDVLEESVMLELKLEELEEANARTEEELLKVEEAGEFDDISNFEDENEEEERENNIMDEELSVLGEEMLLLEDEPLIFEDEFLMLEETLLLGRLDESYRGAL